MDKKTALVLSGMTDKEIREMIQKTLTGDEPDYTEHLKRYTEGKAAKVGAMIDCPQCGITFQKANKWHTFCCSHCKDTWHNERDPARVEALKAKRRKQARG